MGWPCGHRRLPQELHPYWNFREGLSVEDGLVTKSSRLLIPSTLRWKVMAQIHDRHQDIEKCMLKQGRAYFGQELLMTFGRQWNDVEFAS